MRLIVYIRKGKVFVPTLAETQAGYYLDIQPVEVVEASDRTHLIQTLHKRVTDENPVIPTPMGTYPKPVVLAPAGVKS
jgi:hypothetical protein